MLITQPINPKVQPERPRALRWNIDEYYRLGEMGFLRDQHVELINGRIFQMPPQGSSHYKTILLIERTLTTAFGPNFTVRTQGPLSIGARSLPEPDVAVVPGSPRDYDEHPKSALLVIEVSDSTLRFDRTRKALLYARAGIADYWIVNLVDQCIEIHRNPRRDADRRRFRYGDIRTMAATETIAPLAAPQAKIAVADLLP